MTRSPLITGTNEYKTGDTRGEELNCTIVRFYRGRLDRSQCRKPDIPLRINPKLFALPCPPSHRLFVQPSLRNRPRTNLRRLRSLKNCHRPSSASLFGASFDYATDLATLSPLLCDLIDTRDHGRLIFLRVR